MSRQARAKAVTASAGALPTPQQKIPSPAERSSSFRKTIEGSVSPASAWMRVQQRISVKSACWSQNSLGFNVRARMGKHPIFPINGPGVSSTNYVNKAVASLQAFHDAPNLPLPLAGLVCMLRFVRKGRLDFPIGHPRFFFANSSKSELPSPSRQIPPLVLWTPLVIMSICLI
jgi:hypothetical protein